MELAKVCRQLESTFPLKFARQYEPLSFIFPAVNKEAGINPGEIYEKKFLNSCNGLMVKGGQQVSGVFCIVFPNRGVLDEILDRGRPGDFVFTHHCCSYSDGGGFTAIPVDLVKKLRDKHISLYSLHVPFDVNGQWSTAVQLAEAAGIEREGEFAAVFDTPMGIFGRPPVDDLNQLAGIIRQQIGAPEVTVISNRKDTTVKRVAVIAGGGGYANLVNDAERNGCDTYLTGTAIENIEIEAVQDANRRFRQKAGELGINIIGGGHYYTEKVAVEKMTGFFTKLGLRAEFLTDTV